MRCELNPLCVPDEAATIAQGGRTGAIAADAAIRALAHKARINGMEKPVKVAAVASQGRDFEQIPIEAVRKIMEGGAVVFDPEPDKQQDGMDIRSWGCSFERSVFFW